MSNTNHIPTMTPPVVHDYLSEVGRNWKGHGVALELGSWLGASAAALLRGLVESDYDMPFYSYDRWKASEQEVEKAHKQGVWIEKGQDLMPMFLSNVTMIYPNVRAYKGDITGSLKEYPGDPIEVCLFDAPKADPVFSKAVALLKEYWIPEVTVLGLLDYNHYRKYEGRRRQRFLAPVHLIEGNPKCFTKLVEWKGICSCAFFRYEKRLK